MGKPKTDEETLRWWATDLLLEAHAIAPCHDHGYMRLRHSQDGRRLIQTFALSVPIFFFIEATRSFFGRVYIFGSPAAVVQD